MNKLPPIDPEVFDGEKHTITLVGKRCDHVVKLVSSIEAKCSKCGAGWTGNNIQELSKYWNKKG